MKLGIIGQGKMGFNYSLRLLEKGHFVIAYDSQINKAKNLKKIGGDFAHSIEELVNKLERPRIIILAVPHTSLDEILFSEKGLINYLSASDLVIDTTNAFYKDSIKRGQTLEKYKISYLDVGVSGGPAGARNGACLMIGGKKEIFEKVENLFQDLAAEKGYAYLGESGAGHFVKMIHNGIEYGMMQSLAEGFSVLKKSPFNLDLQEIAKIFSHGSVIESKLVRWLEQAFAQYGTGLEEVSGSVEQTGEGLWAVQTASELQVETPVLKSSVEFRKKSKAKPSFTGKILSSLRNQFGGHPIKN